MRRKVSSIVAIFLICTLSLVSCGKTNKPGKGTGEESEKVDGLNVWSYYGGFKDAKDEYEAKYNFKVNINEGVNLNYGNYVNEFLNAVGEENVPDVMVFDSNEFGLVNNLGIFENLFDEQYNIQAYKEGFNNIAWDIGKSFNGKEMVGVAYSSAPLVTYYRQDIFKEIGIEHRPDELGELLKTNWEGIAKKLSEDKSMKVAQFVTDPFVLYTKEYSPFDEKMNFQYTKDNEKFVEILNICKDIYDKGYAMKEDFFQVKEDAVAGDYLAMVTLAPWALAEIKSAGAKDGQWAATSLPFGINGWNASTVLVIPKGSKHKKEAWDFIKMVAFERRDDKSIGSVASYTPTKIDGNIQNEFLAEGQMDQKLYTTLIENHQTKKFITPLDANAIKICLDEINNGLVKGLDVKTIISNIEIAIQLKLQGQIETLKKSLSE